MQHIPMTFLCVSGKCKLLEHLVVFGLGPQASQAHSSSQWHGRNLNIGQQWQTVTNLSARLSQPTTTTTEIRTCGGNIKWKGSRKKLQVSSKKQHINLLINLRFSHIVNLFGGLEYEKNKKEQNVCLELDWLHSNNQKIHWKLQQPITNTPNNTEHRLFLLE